MVAALWLTGCEPGTAYLNEDSSFGLRLRRDFRPDCYACLPSTQARCDSLSGLLVSINAFENNLFIIVASDQQKTKMSTDG
jgi:hypothetical protein